MDGWTRMNGGQCLYIHSSFLFFYIYIQLQLHRIIELQQLYQYYYYYLKNEIFRFKLIQVDVFVVVVVVVIFLHINFFLLKKNYIHPFLFFFALFIFDTDDVNVDRCVAVVAIIFFLIFLSFSFLLNNFLSIFFGWQKKNLLYSGTFYHAIV